MNFDFSLFEAYCKDYWKENKTYQVDLKSTRPKYYILDMFPYPSGSGLHVGHPLGYIASDIVARWKRMCGFHVLHPMGFDAFGLPAEQYAIQTGVHPKDSTETNINRYIDQLDNIGFNYDWSRSVNTSDPKYYKWTQWIFLKLFDHYYDTESNSAKSINLLKLHFEQFGTSNLQAAHSFEGQFTPEEWKRKSLYEKEDILMNFRLAYRKVSYVNWCEALSTVLANDEIKDGVSERGGHPVEKKPMMQWALRITAYADRLLSDLDSLQWSDALKTMQRNWIGKSSGAQIYFSTEEGQNEIEIYTTRPDTIYGVSFLVLAPEHSMIKSITRKENLDEVNQYIEQVSSRSEVERQTEGKNVSGVFSGTYAIHPFTGEKIPIWIAEYVLIEYGTGAIMAVPAHDDRDFLFATKFNLPVVQVIDQSSIESAHREDKTGVMINSPIINGMQVKDAIEFIIQEIERRQIGSRRINFKMRDANFSRQRYWGEPFPIVYSQEGIATPLTSDQLPVTLPHLENIIPGKGGLSPLSHAQSWIHECDPNTREIDTMPGYAGSSWYFLRYMDPNNNNEFVSREAVEYWKDVDLYIGGTEHAVGHLMYSRFWHKFLFDLGFLPTQEPFIKLVNQGMIQGEINRIYMSREDESTSEIDLHFASLDYVNQSGLKNYVLVEVPLSLIRKNQQGKSILPKENISQFLEFKGSPRSTKILTIEGKDILLESEIGKMSKRYHNVVNPDDVVREYGADCFRMYEMFLGPIEQSKPWDTKGISGVVGFLKRYTSLFASDGNTIELSNEEPTNDELKILHTCIKKVNSDLQQLSFNTSVSAFMICVNELKKLNCRNQNILLQLNTLLAPFAPFLTEFIWQNSGGKNSIHHEEYPKHDEAYLQSDVVTYPVSINGKKRYEWTVPVDMPKEEIEKQVLELKDIVKWTEGHTVKKIIFVPGRMINLVI